MSTKSSIMDDLRILSHNVINIKNAAHQFILGLELTSDDESLKEYLKASSEYSTSFEKLRDNIIENLKEE